MIKITPPTEYKKIPWKNGKGETTELAMSNGGSIDQFDWRISIANVVENGEFSDFTGYMRNLVLIAGDGIDLVHGNGQTDRLEKLLSVATFDGGCKTAAVLKSGPITDFNVMTNFDRYKATVYSQTDRGETRLNQCDECFIYSPTNSLELLSPDRLDKLIKHELLAGFLMQISDQNMTNLVVSGELFIITCLDRL
ncbi:MAG: HutD family protein [Anaerolineae bacterium]